jgi:two-component system LytT family response regulator
MTTRIVLVDDEEPARELLRSMIEEWPDATIVGEAADGATALRLIRETSPDLVFLDIQLPGESGLDVAIRLADAPHAPLIVFVTAYDRYAVRAFELNACDYLLKPLDADRLNATMLRISQRRPDAIIAAVAAIRALVEGARPAADARLVVKVDERHVFVVQSEVEWIEAIDKEMHVHTNAGVLRVRESMSSLEARLSPATFIRVHRAAIVNRNHVREIQSWFKGDFAIILKSGARVLSGRTHRSAVERLLDRRPA